MQGSFIVIEGPDGSGTTTQSTILAERLAAHGHTVHLTREPSDNAIGKLIRTILSGEEIAADALQLLFTADRALHLDEEIRPALEAGTTVICEQYVLSTLQFGAAAGLDSAWLASINSRFPRPDLQVILLPPFEDCVRRWSKRDHQEFLEEESFQRRVHDGYRRYAQEHDILVLDTSREKQETADALFAHVLDRLPFPASR